MQKTESFYLAEQAKNMHIIDDELFFVIDEKHNSVDLTDKGIDLLTESYNEPGFFLFCPMWVPKLLTSINCNSMKKS